jgi:hypothetical protein
MGWPVFAKEKANEVENGRKVSLYRCLGEFIRVASVSRTFIYLDAACLLLNARQLTSLPNKGNLSGWSPAPA